MKKKYKRKERSFAVWIPKVTSADISYMVKKAKRLGAKRLHITAGCYPGNVVSFIVSIS